MSVTPARATTLSRTSKSRTAKIETKQNPKRGATKTTKKGQRFLSGLSSHELDYLLNIARGNTSEDDLDTKTEPSEENLFSLSQVERLQNRLKRLSLRLKNTEDELNASQIQCEKQAEVISNLKQKLKDTTESKYPISSWSKSPTKLGSKSPIHFAQGTQAILELRQELHAERLAKEALEEQVRHMEVLMQQVADTRKYEQEMFEQTQQEVSNQVESLFETNSQLHADLERKSRELNRLHQTHDDLKEREVQLQQLVSTFLDHNLISGQNDDSRQKILDELVTPEVLELSQPPPDFPIPQQQPFTTEEFYRMRSILLQRDREIKSLKTQLEDALKQNKTSRASKAGDIKLMQSKISQQQSHLVGAVRRVKWLLYEKEKLDEQIKEKDSYISKLEVKILQQSKALSALPSSGKRSRSSSVSSSGKQRRNSTPQKRS